MRAFLVLRSSSDVSRDDCDGEEEKEEGGETPTTLCPTEHHQLLGLPLPSLFPPSVFPPR